MEFAKQTKQIKITHIDKRKKPKQKKKPKKKKTKKRQRIVADFLFIHK